MPISDPDHFLAQIEDPHTPDIFLRILFRGWGMKAAGVGGLLLSLVVWFFVGIIAGLLTGLVWLIFLFVVCYEMWKSERERCDGLIQNHAKFTANVTEEKKALLGQIESLKNEAHPRLVGMFNDLTYFTVFADMPSDNSNDLKLTSGTRVVLRVSFVNESSMPTTIHNFRLTVKSDDGSEYIATFLERLNMFNNSDKWQLNSGNNFIIFGLRPVNHEDLLNQLIDGKRLEKGEKVSGTLAFDYDINFEDKKQQIEGYKLHIEDALGDWHIITGFGDRPRPSKRLFD